MSDIRAVIPSEVGPSEQSRKAHVKILHVMQKIGTGTALAEAMEKSNSTISRIKNDVLADALELIYHLGFKVVEADRMHIHRDELKMLRALYVKTYEMNDPKTDLFGDMA